MSQVTVWNNALISNPYQVAGATIQNGLTSVTSAVITCADVYDLITDIVIPNQEALLACCALANKRILGLSDEVKQMKIDLRLLIASNERLKKGRL